MDLFQSDRIQNVRRLMLRGNWPFECAYCQEKEARGITSSRQVHNEIHSSDYHRLVTDPQSFIPTIRSMDLRLDNVCNFACRSCCGYASSRWFTEHNLIYPHIGMLKSTVGLEDAQRFWNEFYIGIKQDLKYLHIAGGEPLVSEAHYILLQSLIDSGRTDVELYYDTNLSQLRFKKWVVTDLWKLFPRLTLSLSLDGVGPKGEYIRYGLDYGQWCNNLETIRREVPHARRKMHFVVSVFNVIDLGVHLRTIIDRDFVSPDKLRLTFLRWPPYMNVQTLAPALKARAEAGVRELMRDGGMLGEAVLGQLGALVQFMNERNLYEEHGREFATNTAILDRLRNENALDLFPYLKPMLNAL